MADKAEYPVILRPLSEEDGGGWTAVVPDLPGCMSDGEIGEQAFKNVLGAIEAWEAAAKEEGKKVPAPDSFMASLRFDVPEHLRPQIDELVRQIRVLSPVPASRSEIIAGIMLQFARRQMGNDDALER